MQIRIAFPRATRPCLIGIAACLATATAHANHIDVFLLGGQSNMDGRAPATGLPVPLQSPQTDVLFYEGGSLRHLQPGSGIDFGPEITFGRTIADNDPARTYGLIKHAVGGTDLHNDWDPTTGGVYSGFRNTVTNGLNALTTAGHTYEIVGMLWTQGERDAVTNRTTAQYESDLNEFIADIRTRYGTDLPFFLSRLSSDQTNISPTRLANIRTAQENVAANDPFAYMIDTDGMGMKADNLHFDAPGQIAMGQAFAQSYIDTLMVPADFDGDGDVDGVDLAIMFANFNGPGGGIPANPDTDLDGDGDVDGVDLGLSFAAFTGPLSPAPAPEPGTLALLASTGLSLQRRQARRSSRR